MLIIVAAIATFLVSLGIVLGAYWMFVVRAESTATRAIRKRLEGRRHVERRLHSQLMKKDKPLSTVRALDAVLSQSGSLLDPLKRTLANSALPITLGVILLACGCLAATVFAAVAYTTGSVWLAAAAGAGSAPLPYWYVRRAAAKRLGKLEEQLPQAVEMIAVSLRAGHAFSTGVLMTAEELPPPLGSEFRTIYDEQNYGKPMPDVMKEFAERVPLLDA